MESLIRKTIDNYRILELVARGEGVEILKAINAETGKLVTLKLYDPFLEKDEFFIKRLQINAKALSRAEIPNFISIEDVGETESGFFIVIEYIKGKSLSQLISENGLFSINNAISLTKQLLNAIGYAHKVGVIHRDIKPSNIFLSDDGSVKINECLTQNIHRKALAKAGISSEILSLFYASPEQIKGYRRVDIRTDIYSLGMTIYEMITGRVPFEKTDSNYDICKKIVNGKIPSPRKFNNRIPKKLEKIIIKAIHKDPSKRYQSAEEMLNDIEKFEKESVEVKKSRNIFKRKSNIPASIPLAE